MIVVTGMHRSGTSFVSRLLVQLGLDFGDPAELLAADDWNATGYFEARDVLDLNSRIVTGFPRTTGRLRSALSQMAYLRMPGADAIARRASAVHDDLRLLGDRYVGLAVKDPRFCLTLPIWRGHTEVSHVVVSVRHPLAVARSLQRRQRIPLRIGLRFWAYHVQTLLRGVPHGDGFFVEFEVLRGPHAATVAGSLAGYLGLDADPAAIQSAIAGSLRPDLVHHSSSNESLGAELEATWDLVRERVRASCTVPAE